MLRRARGRWAALAFGSTVTVGLVFGTVCSVARAGLSNGDASVSSGGSGGVILSTGLGGLGSGGGNGGSGSGSGGAAGAGQTGGAGDQATGGAGTGGAGATGGAVGAGGIVGSGGAAGSGDTTGAGGASGSGGTNNTGGAMGTGGAINTGGATGTGGMINTGGANGSGGAKGAGGLIGTGGSHPPSCSQFPTGSSFTTPTDGLLHCYWVHSDNDWTSSENRCVSDGGTLATILSSQENMFVLQVLLQANLFKGDGVSLGAMDGKSSSDKSGAGQYAWVTGEPWAYTNWHADQPSGTCTCQGFISSTCTCDHWLAMFSDGTWHDVMESTARPYICEAVAR
jgi:hypothetical protein